MKITGRPQSQFIVLYRVQGTNNDRTADLCKKSAENAEVVILCKAACDWLIKMIN